MYKPLDRRTRYARYLNAYNAHGMTTMHIAQLRGNSVLVLKLLEAGASELPMKHCKIASCNNRCRKASSYEG
jgi:hypothetical protein